MSTPAALSNIAPAKCCAEPLPDEAYETAFFFAFASATISFTDVAGNDGFTNSTFGNNAMTPIGLNALSLSYGNFANSAGFTANDDASSISVWPSDAAFATALAPICPLAPGLFSTTTVCPSASPSFGAIRRAIVSAPPPGGYVTTREIGLAGHTCACAAKTVSDAAIAARNRM